MKKFAARDFENVAACSVPILEGLFTSQSTERIVLDLMFICCCWQVFSSLRLHTDSTLEFFKHITTELGYLLRRFAKDSEKYNTVELPREARKRKRHSKSSSDSGTRIRRLNNQTVKTHALGDFPWAIKYFGTADGWDTRIGENLHQDVKEWYDRTNKRDHTAQIARHEKRTRVLNNLRRRNHLQHSKKIAIGIDQEEPLPFTNPEAKVHMATGKRFFLDLDEVEELSNSDCALVQFVWKLKFHVLRKLYGENLEFCQEDLDAVIFENNRIYRHKVVRINHTTYDLRRDQDSINPRTHADIIALAPPENHHPFVYGRVIGVFHANVRICQTNQLREIRHQQIEFLWVRWLEYDSMFISGWKAKRLPRIHFLHSDDPHAFDFIDPVDVIRGVHLIPAFDYGGTQDYLPADSIARQYEAPTISGPREVETDDWIYYYVNIFSDSDMAMLFLGGGVGHQHLIDYLKPFATEAGLDEQILPQYDSDGEEVPLRVDEIEQDIEAENENHTSDADENMEHGEIEECESGNSESEDSDEADSDGDFELGPEDGEAPDEGDDDYI
ncbi:hypothetical protein VKT23_019760 [Stygiomarasmius scandens]|uniref:Uncharacterized protein n=1 Tax=Marasmiellus scandens TaxID=2682957 RepID=A0ABR1IKH1_9AGAR